MSGISSSLPSQHHDLVHIRRVEAGT